MNCGWSWDSIDDGVSLSILILMWRQVAMSRGEEIGMNMGDLDLIDWMERNGKKPGDDMSAFFDSASS